MLVLIVVVYTFDVETCTKVTRTAFSLGFEISHTKRNICSFVMNNFTLYTLWKLTFE